MLNYSVAELRYNNKGAGADISRRVSWARVLTHNEADRIKIDIVFPDLKEWSSYHTVETEK